MKKIAIALAASVAAVGLTAGSCESSPGRVTTPEGMCAYLVGNGNQLNGNRTVNDIIYPGNSRDYNQDYDQAKYFPCGPRNYIVSPNSGDAGGKDLLVGRTKQGTSVQVSASAYWMPNLQESVLRQFITLCQKYNCANDNLDGNSNASNFASPGWNGMLAENFHPAFQRAAAAVLPTIDDSAWQSANQDERNKLAAGMSDRFLTELQTVTGFTAPLFCSSGSTGSKTSFDCGNIRIVVDYVAAADNSLQQQTDENIKRQREIEMQRQAAQARIDLTNQLYGPDLGAVVRACQDVQSSCVIANSPVQVHK
ncbi:hypothetical protein FHT44_004916 [Mycolicibacterium sp. BK634]|uniref:hypothetical protein n=1 Tax=Mycolicibacterium sp. BK634 TaxID=2587099 RepID=UPI001609E461|nr:hypothetical protein [Mycolicibacterium sp. BK634]MBB3752404.1 hypothetical protein [Mycolicibacterium sp. BK634]